jgi:hypothetical protein
MAAPSSSRSVSRQRNVPLAEVLERLFLDESDDDISDGSEVEDEVIQESSSTDDDVQSSGDMDISNADNPSEQPSVSNSLRVEADNVESDDEGETVENLLKVLKVPTNLYGKNKYKWSATVPVRTRTPIRNLVIGQPGNKAAAVGVSSIISAWSLFFSDDILNDIVTYTNLEIAVQRLKYRSDRPEEDDEGDPIRNVRPSFVRDVTVVELKALLGLYYLAGVLNMNAVTSRELFDKDSGVGYFRATMTEKRFEFLTNCIRFDDRATRQQRREHDRLAPIRTLFESIVNTSQQLYTPSETCTVDEQLLAFRGRCPFKMYIPSKPDKYGIKIIMMCDSKTYYMSNASVYIGKGSTTPGIPVTEFYSIQMTAPIHGTNRNCTFDNWFTSIPTAQKLHDDHSVTVVGTLKKNKAEIPPSFVELRGREKNTAMFAFSGVKTLLSYCPPKSTKKKIVMMLSTMHTQADKTATSRIPEIVEFYNSTKCGVDTFDQLCHRYSVSRRTRRWPMCIFYGILNAVGINSMILLTGSGAQDKEVVPNRRTYLKTLAKALITPHMEARLAAPTLPKHLRLVISSILKIEPVPEAQAQRRTEVGRCSFCPRSRDRKTRTSCNSCQKFICAEHQHKICPDCAEVADD